MKKYLALLYIMVLTIGLDAQVAQNKSENKSNIVVAAVAPVDLAKATLQAHGGDKLLSVKTLIIRGSADLSTSASAQVIPAAFATIFSGTKYRFDIQSPFFNFNQIFDGEQNYSSIGNFSLPLDKSGPALLMKVNENGYTVSELPEKLKKKKGFRITSPDGFYTDFIVNEKSGQIKEYESSYQVGSATLTTSVDIEKYREVEGVWINEKFSQRLETPQGSFYANFKAKDILVNSEVSNDVFAIPK